jgi:muconate cycloisomerase
MPDATIITLRVTPVRVPMARPMVTALGDIRSSEYAVLELVCDSGITGLGEISLIWHGNGALLGTSVAPLLRQVVTGRSIHHRTAIMSDAVAALAFGRHSLTALAALEMALLDAQGQVLGVPVHTLLGGTRRERILASVSLPVGPIDDTITYAQELAAEGFVALKIKGLRDPDYVESVCAGLRRKLGKGVLLRVDLNMACRSPKEALAIAQRIEPYQIQALEQPLGPDDLSGLAFLRSHSPIPLMLDESIWDARDAQRAIAAQAIDIANIYVAEAGGPAAAMTIADICHLAGVPVTVGSMPELGIGTAAAAHLAAALCALEFPADVIGFRYHSGDVVRHELHIVDGYLLTPSGPGLGLSLDPAALAAHAIGETV